MIIAIDVRHSKKSTELHCVAFTLVLEDVSHGEYKEVFLIKTTNYTSTKSWPSTITIAPRLRQLLTFMMGAILGITTRTGIFKFLPW